MVCREYLQQRRRREATMTTTRTPLFKALIAAAALLGVFLVLHRRSQPLQAPEIDESLLEEPHPRDIGGWHERHLFYVQKAQAGRKNKGYELLVYGDSITEAFYGGFIGHKMENYSGNAEAWRKRMATPRPGHRPAVVFSISGDRISHLRWRLANGEGPEGLSPKAIVVLIGTNDVGYVTAQVASPEEAARRINAGIQAVVQDVRRHARQAAIVVLSLPPLQPQGRGAPLPQLQATVDAVNTQMQHWVGRWAKRSKPPLVWHNCSGLFLNSDGSLKLDWMPDGVHPQGPGGEALLQCMLKGLQRATGSKP